MFSMPTFDIAQSIDAGYLPDVFLLINGSLISAYHFESSIGHSLYMKRSTLSFTNRFNIQEHIPLSMRRESIMLMDITARS